jgi:2-polyprenyl-6-methoxyphenol hydroxylase-like FAD-dependent oxidoreductase
VAVSSDLHLAAFGYYEGARPLAEPVAGNILSAAFADGWFWYIPLHDGTTSVGAVVDATRFAGEAGGDPLPLYLRLVEACAPVAERVRDARLVSAIRVIRDYSYDSRSFHGPGYLLAGDAACFIDPVFPTGVHLASLSGYLASRAVTDFLAGGAREELLAASDTRYRHLSRPRHGGCAGRRFQAAAHPPALLMRPGACNRFTLPVSRSKTIRASPRRSCRITSAIFSSRSRSRAP